MSIDAASKGSKDHAVHVHSHGHGPPQGARGGADRRTETRRLLLTLGLTATILVAEAVGGWLTGSLALLADAGHMLTDLSALLVSLLAIRLATRPADRSKTFGYQRVEVLAALTNGLLLMGLSVALFHEAWERFADPPEIHTIPMVLVALVGLVANVVGLWLLAGSRSNINVRGAFLHILGDTISSAGVVVGGLVMWGTGFFWIDPILTFVIGIVIIVSATSLVREAVDVLLEAVPCHVDLEDVVGLLADTDGVEDVHDVHVWTITSGMVALSGHLVVAPETAAADTDRILTAVKEALLERWGIAHTTLQVESRDYKHVGLVHD